MTLSLFSLEGRVAVITGGNSGLGRAIALGFCDAGAKVAVTGRNTAKNNKIRAELGECGAAFTMDVRSEFEIERAMQQVFNQFGRLDILVNNAGLVKVGAIVATDIKDWNEVVDTNLNGAFLCARQAARLMIARGAGGKIINISSVQAHYGPWDFASYAASKAGINALTRALAVELAPHNIQVNTIEPGYFDTEMSAGFPDWLRRQITNKAPARRFGKPEELVGAAVFLASSASDYVTGSTIRVDGGYCIAERVRPEAPPPQE